MTSELNLVRAEASLTRAKADVATLQNNLKNSTVVAGISGVLESLNVESGQFVKKNQNIVNVRDASNFPRHFAGRSSDDGMQFLRSAVSSRDLFSVLYLKKSDSKTQA